MAPTVPAFGPHGPVPAETSLQWPEPAAPATTASWFWSAAALVLADDLAGPGQ